VASRRQISLACDWLAGLVGGGGGVSGGGAAGGGGGGGGAGAGGSWCCVCTHAPAPPLERGVDIATAAGTTPDGRCGTGERVGE